MAGVLRRGNKRRNPVVATTMADANDEQKQVALAKLKSSLKDFKESKDLQDAISISKQVGQFLYLRKNGVPDKIAENKANALMANILIGIAEQRPAGDIIKDLRRLVG